MSAKTPGDSGLRKTWKKTGILLVLAILSALFLSAPADAGGVPSKVIVFTDKKVYAAWWVASGQANSVLSFNGYDADFGDVYVYAIILDDDGKIMKGRTITGTLNDTVEYDHDEKADATYHNNILSDPNLYDRNLIFNDTGLNGDGVASDGIYTAKTTLSSSSLGLSSGNTREENHIKLRVYANDTAGGLSAYTESLISFTQCMNGLTANAHGGTHIKAYNQVDNCAVCHIGYEHFFENKSGTFADSQLDIHALKWNPADVTSADTCEQGFDSYIWNRSYIGAKATGCTTPWETLVPGSKYCFRCHISGTTFYDYDNTNTNTGATTRVNTNDKPSCNNAGCHSTTDIEAATVLPWTQAGAVSGAGQNNSNIWKQKSHNHSTTPTANVSCALCHLTQHGFTRPNASTTNLTQICETCHNRSDGWINITQNQSHPKTTACKNCHTENNKLDAHIVPTGSFGGRWCLDCHKINGKAPIFIDEAIVNVSNPNYIHYRLNNKSDATNSSRICWACHTNDTVVQNNIVNSTQIPLSTHPQNYTAPRKCLDCHNKSTGINFNSPQTQRHTWYASTIRTTAVTYCNDCHVQSESVLSYNQSATAPKNDNTSASHYGKNRTDFKSLVGQKAYCANCHQNESTVFGPFAKESNKVRSDHASNITTPSCGNNTCHRNGSLHNANLVKPNFTEGNISLTCLSCHNSSNYNYHNNTLTCWDCHLNDTAGNIHPIQFVQYNGNFTGAKLTGATCYDCHKTNNVDNTTQRLAGTTPPKIYSQSHSNDPINGTKWGNYWKYTPTVYQFASYEFLGNGSIDPAHPFSNIETPSNDYMELNETQTGRVFEAIFPSAQEDWEFTISQGSWTGAIVVDPAPVTLSGSYDSGIGNPAGSLKVTDTDSTANNEYAWTSPGFYYNGTGAIFKYANFSMDRRRTQNDGTTRTNVTLVRPVSGNVVIYSSGAQTGTDVSFTNINVSDISSYLTNNGTYKIIINTTYVASGGAGPSTTYYDNVKLMIKEKVWNRYEFVVNTTGVPLNGSSMLGMAYQVHRENTSLQIYNKTSKAYELLDTLDKGVFYDYTKNINSTYINSTDGITGNVSVKFIDNDQSDTDAVSDYLNIRYLYVYTDRGLQYPCEQCHSPNKHYVNPTLGSPSKFSAGNQVNQTIDSSSTWCQQCHWQGAANYSKMIQEFNVTRNPPENVPPEITGNKTYGNFTNASDGTLYKNHSGFDMTDLGCFNCHGGSLSQSAGMTAFVHGVSEGVSGGANCTNCHNVGRTPPKTGSLVNFTAMNDTNAIHRNLNSNANSPSGYPAENKKCWACHGNGSEPPANDHPTKYNNPYRCEECHVTRQNLNYTPNNTLLNVTQHYWSGTNISTTVTSCYSCHNRSEMMVGLALDPDGEDAGVYGGANGGNNSSSHYGLKRSNLGGYTQDTNGYCSYCHTTTTNNATFFVSDFNNTIFNHSARTSTPLCSACHSTGRLHNVTLAKPVSNDSYCSTCHGTSGTAATKDKLRHKALNCTECHANNSAGTLAGKDIHAVKYLTQSNIFATSNSSAVNCVTCHQTSSVDSSLGSFSAFKIVSTMKHSNNVSNGSVWDSYWTNTTSQTACIYCHNNTLHNTTPLGRILQWAPNYNMYDAIGSNITCSDCHWKGDNNYTQMNSAFASAGLKTPPEITNGTSWKGNFSNYKNHSLEAYDDAACKNCHGSLLSGSANMSEFMHNAAIGVDGGANCTNCHNTGGTAGAGKLVNFSAMNDSLAIHRNLNSGDTSNTSLPAENRKCWACHGNGSAPSGHPSRYNTPYNCTNCHVKGSGQNFNYTPASILNVTQHYWNGTSINTTNATSCYVCHNKSEMMTGMSLDPDGASPNIYSGANGGNLSVSHYGRKRSDMAGLDNNTYCNYCHNNQTGAFPFMDSSNRTIANHSMNYAATNPACSACHASGRLHNDTLYRPVFALPNSTYCLSCHGTGGSATIKNLEQHNGTTGLNCTQCHLNSTRSIHPVRYLQQGGSTWSTSNGSAVNCTSCHQSSGLTNFSKAPLVQIPIWHSNNSYSGALWNGTQQSRFWDNTSQQSSCDYCHGKQALHNLSGLGKSALVQANNSKNQSLTGSYWCSNCHFKGKSAGDEPSPSGKYNYKGDLFSPIPPEVFNLTGLVPANASDNTPFQNHSTNIGSDWSDSRCKACHGKDMPSDITSATFLHKLNQSSPEAGEPDCLKCHASTAPTGPNRPPLEKRINATAFTNYSVHRDLNKDAVNTTQLSDNRSKACWACHGTGAEPVKHPADYLNPKPCEYCHVNNNFNATPVYSHYPGSVFAGSIVYDSVDSNRTCISCHNNSQVANLNITYGSYEATKIKNATISHYAVNRTLGESLWLNGTVTDVLPDTKNTTGSYGCNQCHAVGGSGGIYGPDYGKARDIPCNHNKMGLTGVSCQSSCHNSNSGVNVTLHDKKVGMYLGITGCYSSGCHTAPTVVRRGR